MILRSEYIDRLIAEHEGSKEAARPRDLTNLWCQHGCPRKLSIHVGGKTIILIDGSLMPNPEEREAPIINNLRGDAKASPVCLPVQGDAKGWCQVCGQQYPAVRSSGKYCSPRCRRAAYRARQKKASRARLVQERADAIERKRLELRD
jgi:hypothetical protein